MKLLLFDWVAGGHHAMYLRRFAAVLRDHVDVVVASPDSEVGQFAELGLETIALGTARPGVDSSRHLDRAVRRAGQQELDLFRRCRREARVDHAWHLFADGLMRWLIREPSSGIATTLLLFRPRAHYPSLYQTPLNPRERAVAYVYEGIVARWRRRPDAHALFTFDEGAVSCWARRRGAPAYWLPEAPVEDFSEGSEAPRSGCVVFGSLSPVKGIHLIANALALHPTEAKLVLAGRVAGGYKQELEHHVSRIRESGALVECRFGWLADHHIPQLLASARCALITYTNFHGSSRVLLEAAAAGTPVVATERGLIGHLVRQYNLGAAVDCDDPKALRSAILHYTRSNGPATHSPYLRRFVARYSPERWRAAVTAPLRIPTGPSGDGQHASP